MNPNATPLTPLLRREYRRVRQTGLIWSAGLVFTAVTMILGTRLGWWKVRDVWVAIPAVLSAVALVAWVRRANGFTKTRFVRQMDARWRLHARLETAEELSADQSALARAQRTETAERISGHERVGVAGWLAGWTLLALALGFLAVEGSVFAVRAMRAKPAVVASDEKAAAPVGPEASASIDWKTPEREIKATAIEEVPLTAMAESARGYSQVSLEVFVNGKHQLTRPLDAAAAGSSADGGLHELTPSLYLDETGAKAFDIVSYHLRGELVGGTPGKAVTSPLQFIQIRPPQRDVAKLGKVNPEALRLLAMLSALKLGQLQLIEANFALTHLTEVRTGAAWQRENVRAATDQGQLATKTEETRAFASGAKAPSLILDNLDDAREAMQQAVKAMESQRNEDATEPQGRALALITECEKLFNEAVEVTGDMPPVAMQDPFTDEQAFKLEPRSVTPAGQLEALVGRQGSLVRRIGQPKTGQGEGAGGIGGDQAAIANAAGELASGGELEDKVQESAAEAAKAAAAASRQIGAEDFLAAREPAGTAWAALQKAVDVQERTGRAIAVAELARLRAVLNAASRAGDADRRAKLAAVRQELRAAGLQQQRTGSAVAAAQMATLADELGATKLPGSTSQPNSPERALDAAVAAARIQVGLGARQAALKRAVRMLKRPGGTGAEARTPDVLVEVELASQEAEWLTSQPSLNEQARQLATRAGAMQAASTGAADAGWQTVASAAAKIASALETAQVVGARDEVVKRFNPDDIDPAYREAVEMYFERLSREGAESVPPAPSAKP